MSRKQYRIDEFIGINQSCTENVLSSAFTCDACNMDTTRGSLKVAKGYVKHIENPVPDKYSIYRMTTFTGSDGIMQYIVATNTAIYSSRGTTWTKIYDYGSQLAMCRFDFLQAKIGSVDYLLISCGERQMVKYDGETASLFGSQEMLSNRSVLYLDIYRSRLFAAGDPVYPNRLYWSQLPGDTRSIENWSSDVSSVNVEGGHTEIGSTSNDPIVAIHAMSNQLLIFKQHSLYRLIGDKPSNFTVERIDALFDAPAYTAIVPYGDSLVFLTSRGLCLFNGVTVRPLADADYIQDILKNSFTFESKGTYCDGKFYFTLSEGVYYQTNALLEYDPLRHAYMIRRGFTLKDIHAVNNTLFSVSGARYIYRFNEGDTYDGTPIEAWWKTPASDLLEKTSIKALRTIALRGSAENNSRVLADIQVDKHTDTHAICLPQSENDIVELPLKNEGRIFSIKFYNENGGSFCINGGVELLFEQWRRTE